MSRGQKPCLEEKWEENSVAVEGWRVPASGRCPLPALSEAGEETLNLLRREPRASRAWWEVAGRSRAQTRVRPGAGGQGL